MRKNFEEVINSIKETNSGLTREEECVLYNLMKAGGEAGEKAREILILSNLRLVDYIANKIRLSSGNDKDLEDLVAFGYEGLIMAADRFDATRGGFGNYAYNYILNYINSGIQEVYNHFCLSNRRLKNIEKGSLFSLDNLLSDDNRDTFEDMLVDENTPDPLTFLTNQECKEDFNTIFSFLNERERTVLALHYGFNEKMPMTYEEIANLPEFGVSKERVRMIQENAIGKINRSPKLMRLVADMEF